MHLSISEESRRLSKKNTPFSHSFAINILKDQSISRLFVSAKIENEAILRISNNLLLKIANEHHSLIQESARESSTVSNKYQHMLRMNGGLFLESSGCTIDYL